MKYPWMANIKPLPDITIKRRDAESIGESLAIAYKILNNPEWLKVKWRTDLAKSHIRYAQRLCNAVR